VGAAPIDFIGLTARLLVTFDDDGIERSVHLFDPFDTSLYRSARPDRSFRDRSREFARRQHVERSGIRGTRRIRSVQG
jgi:hypothetical protein